MVYKCPTDRNLHKIYVKGAPLCSGEILIFQPISIVLAMQTECLNVQKLKMFSYVMTIITVMLLQSHDLTSYYN